MAKKPSKQPKKSTPKIKLHRSFHRSYREDYKRELKVPSIFNHICLTFKSIFSNWKIFLPLLIIAIILNVLFVGIMDESTYTEFQDILDQTSTEYSENNLNNFTKSGLLLISTITTGGLSGEASEASIVFGIIIFLVLWLTTIFVLRRRLAGKKVTLRESLYNSMTPLISTLLVFLVILIQCIPIILLIIAYSAAVQTEFLATPFYALVFFIFAALMVILSSYLLSSSLLALVAVSAPGLYPMQALNAASDLMAGRRINFLIRLISLIIFLVLIWTIIMLPLITFDLWMKTFEWTAGIPFIPICLNILTCFTCIYVTTYLYLYYKWMLKHDEN